MRQLLDFLLGVAWGVGLTVISVLWIATLGDWEVLFWLRTNTDPLDYIFTFVGTGLGFCLAREIVRRRRATR